ncbi:MAG: tetratricopeptide repeat protein, partial [Oscillibacter sp.]|nr:tetratricopeptide repeat protein [Oscillibacter sp.]
DVGDYPRAESMYRQALNIDDTDAQIHNKLSVALREQGKLSEALDENITAIAIDATVGEYHFHKGLTLQRMGNRKNANGANNEAMVDYEHAKNAFEEAINRDSKVAQYHFALATVVKDMARYEDAEVEYRAAIVLESGNEEYHVGYAYVLSYQDRLEDALNEIQTAVTLNPNNSEARMLMQSIQFQLERHES